MLREDVEADLADWAYGVIERRLLAGDPEVLKLVEDAERRAAGAEHAEGPTQ